MLEKNVGNQKLESDIMDVMSGTDVKTAIEELTGSQETDPAYEAWFRAKVQDTLDKKARGEMTYRSLEDVAADLGFNAR